MMANAPLRFLLLEDGAADAELVQDILEVDGLCCEIVRVQPRAEFVAALDVFFFSSRRRHTRLVSDWSSDVCSSDLKDRVRREPYAVRRKSQLDLPPYPTTTIGSFPQTTEVRAARRKLNDNQLSAEDYDRFIEAQVAKTIKLQEEIGLDVLVHGEFERNDMVEYFGEQLAGFAFTEHGWVQSYGTRYVKPPIIFGDVSRPRAMTVRWSKYAQSLTQRPVKGMLTGPVT